MPPVVPVLTHEEPFHRYTGAGRVLPTRISCPTYLFVIAEFASDVLENRGILTDVVCFSPSMAVLTLAKFVFIVLAASCQSVSVFICDTFAIIMRPVVPVLFY